MILLLLDVCRHKRLIVIFMVRIHVGRKLSNNATVHHFLLLKYDDSKTLNKMKCDNRCSRQNLNPLRRRYVILFIVNRESFYLLELKFADHSVLTKEES